MKILEMHTDRFWKGEAGVRGLVEDEGQTWRVNLQVKDGRIRDYSCTCPEGNSYKGVCAHGEALFAYYEEYEKQMGEPPVQTSQEVWSMIRRYTNRQVAGLMAGEEQGQVELVPELTLSGRDCLRVSWLVEREKALKVRDLGAFCDNVRGERYGEYGKTMGFYHSPSSFRQESRLLLSFLLETAGEQCRGGEMVLEPRSRDRFFKLVLGRTLKVWIWNQAREMEVREEDPRLKLSVKRCGADGIQVSFLGFLTGGEKTAGEAARTEAVRTGAARTEAARTEAAKAEAAGPVFAQGCLEGEERLYLVFEDKICCCSPAFRQTAGPFLKAFSLNRKVTAAGRDVPLFFTRVLKALKPMAVIDQEDVRLEDYEPQPLQAVFRFDSPGKNQVVMEPILSYGNIQFHPVEDENLPRSLCRDVPGEFRVSRLISRYFRYKTPDGLKVVLRDDEEALYDLMRDGIQEFSRLGQVEVTEEMKRLKVLPPPLPSVQLKASRGWLDLKVEAGDLEAGELEGILAAYESRKKYYRLKSGEFLALEEGGLKVVSRLVKDLGVTKKELRQGEIRLPAYRALYLDEILRQGGQIRCHRDRDFKEMILAMTDEEARWQVPASLESTLRDYQKEGFCWLKTLAKSGFGGILADDMGLGKTIQVIALLLDAYGVEGETLPSLIICPASLVYNWEREMARFGPELKTRLVVGNGEQRNGILEELKKGQGQVFITSYDLFRRDAGLYRNLDFAFQIIDEAQYIKNASTQNARAVKSLRARHRVALTGTPVENRLGELWSIFDFLMPGFLFTFRKFHQDYEIPAAQGDGEALNRLRRITAPFILRRIKEDVLRELPPKTEQEICAGLEGEQKKLYTAWAGQLRKRLEEKSGGLGEERFSVLADLMRLRQICCDPRLAFGNYKGPSAKLETCMQLVRQGVEGGHRILLFSQFTSMLELIEEQLSREEIPFLKLTGETSKEERSRLVQRFAEKTEPVFLISLKAGGTGLNLTAADLVIHYDPWWNVAAQNQATDRTHRIGQERQVTVYRLIAKDTVEENMLALQKAKEQLASEVVSSGAQEGLMNREALLKLLKEREPQEEALGQ